MIVFKAKLLGDCAVLPCSHCQGSGLVELTGEYLTTLLRVRDLGREVTGAELGRLMGVKGPAMNNRLARLERLGLVTSRRQGKRRFFRCN